LTLDRATNKEAALLTKGLVTPENEQNVANALHKMGKLEIQHLKIYIDLKDK